MKSGVGSVTDNVRFAEVKRVADVKRTTLAVWLSCTKYQKYCCSHNCSGRCQCRSYQKCPRCQKYTRRKQCNKSQICRGNQEWSSLHKSVAVARNVTLIKSIAVVYSMTDVRSVAVVKSGDDVNVLQM